MSIPKGRKLVHIDLEVWAFLQKHAEAFESVNACLRRVLGFPPVPKGPPKGSRVVRVSEEVLGGLVRVGGSPNAGLRRLLEMPPAPAPRRRGPDRRPRRRRRA